MKNFMNLQWPNFYPQFNSIQFSCSIVFNSLRPQEPQQAWLHCPSPTPGVYLNSCPLSQWCPLTISSSVKPFSSCPQSFATPGSFQMSQLFTPGGQSIGVSASTSVLPMNTQDWFPLGWTGWISLQSKGLSKVFSNTTVQETQMYRTDFGTLGEGEGGMFWENIIKTCILSMVKQITSPGWVYETSARTWCPGKTQRNWVEREVGGGVGIGNTCKSMADSCQCMTKITTIL